MLNYVEKAFGPNHRNLQVFQNAREDHIARGLHRAAPGGNSLRRLVTSTAPNINPISSGVYLLSTVHDGELKHASARLVTNLGLEPAILHEQANKGRTIIEKFTDHAQVGFAIVLLSADDEGRPRDTSAALLKLRAKQNVIFEMRFLFSRLGRERVCVVYESGVELPSDLSGILYVQYDSGKGWMYAVAEEMKAAGYEVDLNAV
jgi:predicted nucleotide-binding protein